MIKPANKNDTSLTYSDRRVLLDDLAQTTCYLNTPSEKCEETIGVNILDLEDVAPDNFFIHVAKDKTSKWFLQDHKAVRLSRKIPLESAMRESDEIELTEQIKP